MRTSAITPYASMMPTSQVQRQGITQRQLGGLQKKYEAVLNKLTPDLIDGLKTYADQLAETPLNPNSLIQGQFNDLHALIKALAPKN